MFLRLLQEGTNPVGQDLLQTFLNVLVATAAPILLGLFGAALRLLYLRVRLSLSAKQLDFADMVIRQFVKAAEQYDLGGVVKQVGYEKKAWVIEQAEKELKRRGINLELDTISDLIEAAVLDELNRPRLESANGTPTAG